MHLYSTIIPTKTNEPVYFVSASECAFEKSALGKGGGTGSAPITPGSDPMVSEDGGLDPAPVEL